MNQDHKVKRTLVLGVHIHMLPKTKYIKDYRDFKEKRERERRDRKAMPKACA